MVKLKQENTDNIKKKKIQSFTNAAIFIGALILINLIAQYKFIRADLTQDKRYTLGKPSRELLKSLDDKVYIRVYLEGDLPAGFRRLKESSREMLDEMRAISGRKIEYDFIDPLKGVSPSDENDIYMQLMEEGLEPINLEVVSKSQKTQKVIFPGATIFYKGNTLPVKLLKQQIGVPPEQVLHNSILSLEYDIISTIKKLADPRKSKIAFIEGHGELSEKQSFDIMKSLEEYYDVKRIDITKYKVGILDEFNLIIIAKPTLPFSELAKYHIDQFVVRGGSVLWMIDQLLAEIDSLSNTGITSSIAYNLNLDDMFFKYGVKINYNLLQDLQCHFIPVLVDKGTPQQDFRPWLYYPVVFPNTQHPIVNNLSALWFRFAGTIDTTANPAIKKTPLLFSSPDSRMLYNPVRISIVEAHREPNVDLFDKGQQMLAVLTEGRFNSIFTNRLSPATLKREEYGQFKSEAVPAKMIFISDGDIAANQVSSISDQYYPLGYDRFTRQTFGNKNFILNAVDYLIDDSGIMELRSKDFRLRLLNKSKVNKEKKKWQFINLFLPAIFILIFGSVYSFIRKKRFAIKINNKE